MPRTHPVLDKIETLRIARQQEVRDHPHPLLKRFTQQEVTDEACPTYKNLLVGRSRRVPSRKTLVQIAQYLECSAKERNDLLLLTSRQRTKDVSQRGRYTGEERFCDA